MNTRVLLITAIVIVAAAVFTAADHIPGASGTLIEFESRTSLLMDLGRFDPLLELEGRFRRSVSAFFSASPCRH